MTSSITKEKSQILHGLQVGLLFFIISFGFCQEYDDPLADAVAQLQNEVNLVWSSIGDVINTNNQQGALMDLIIRNMTDQQHLIDLMTKDVKKQADEVAKMKRDMTEVQGSMQILNAWIDYDGQFIQNNTNNIRQLQISLDRLAKDVSDLRNSEVGDVSLITGNIRSLNSTVKKLGGVNKIWKGNFKIVKEILQNIKKKVKVPMGVINFN